MTMGQNTENKLTRYALAYDYILQLLELSMNNENIGLGAMGDKDFFKMVADKMGLVVEGFSWDEFSISVEHLDEDHPALVYDFPTPRTQTEALYGAIVIDHKENKLSYFTLEKGRTEDRWALGFNSPNERQLLGLFDIAPSKEKFFELIMGAAQLFLKGDTRAVFTMPDDYQLLKNLEDDPKNCLNYAKETESCATFIQLFAIERMSTMDWGEDQKIIDGIHQSLAENQALIEVKCDKTRRGYHYVYSIVKTLEKPSGVQYFLLMQVLYGHAALNIKAFFSEKGMTGQRDAAIFELAVRKGIVSPSDTSNWACDPYDKDFKHPCLMNLSEDRKYDELFPGHPLSQCRGFIKTVIEQ